MKKHTFILTIIFLISFLHSFGCSCNFGGPFLKVSREADLTIIAKISSKKPWKLNVEIENILLGKTDKKKINIIGDKTGASCYKVLNNYLIGETYAFALKKMNNKYYLSACGEYSLKIENSIVKGMINDSYIEDIPKKGPRWNNKTMDKSDFISLFEGEGNSYSAPCRALINYQPSDALNQKFEKAKKKNKNKEEFKTFEFYEAIEDYNLPLVEFYISELNLMEHKIFPKLVLTAVEKGYIDLINLFLEKGMSPNLHDKYFYLVYRAVLYPDLLKLLHKKGAKLNPKGYGGTTTIVHAVREGCIESIGHLIKNGADLKEKIDSGKKAIYYLKYNERNKKEVKKYLKSLK